jgi:23S rRNA pseudouridine1911/1915/1917 synthase
MTPNDERVFHLTAELQGQTLAAALRRWLPGQSWSAVRELVARRRIQINGNLCLDPARRLSLGEVVKLLPTPAAKPPAAEQIRIRFLDTELVVVEKPAGITTLRHVEELDWPERRRQLQPTLDELLPRLIAREEGRDARRNAPHPRVRAVHRLDRDTSGLMVFARTVEAERALGAQFKKHSIHRLYLALANGRISEPRTFDTYLVRNRGDGRRGSTRLPHQGKRAITHIRPLEALGAFTLVECRLETGRTHQIRIHLAEAGCPLAGEKVYNKPLTGPAKADPSGAPRIMLHAAELGFDHPRKGTPLSFSMPPPADFIRVLSALRAQVSQDRS